MTDDRVLVRCTFCGHEEERPRYWEQYVQVERCPCCATGRLLRVDPRLRSDR